MKRNKRIDNRSRLRGLLAGKSGANSNFHVQILLTVALSVALSIVLLSTILYIYFENIVVARIFESEKGNLFQAGVSTRLMQELSRSIAIQMYNDNALSGLFFSARNEPLATYHALSNLKKYKNLIPYVHSIYIYNPMTDTFYINSPAKTLMIQPRPSFYDVDADSVLEESGNFNSLVPIPRIIREPGTGLGSFDEYGVYTFVYNLSGARSAEHSGTIVINISEEWVRDIIDSVDLNPDSKTLIIDSDDRLLISDSESRMLSKAGLFKHIRFDAADGMGSGTMVIETDGEKKLLLYSYAQSVSWIFVKLLPYDRIMSGLFEMRKNLLIIAFAILVLGLLVSYVLAKRLYKPIDDVLAKLFAIEGERKSDTRVMRQHNLNRLLVQSKRLSDYELNKFLEELDIDFQTGDRFCLVMLEIDRFAEYRERYPDREQILVRVGILDSASQLLAENYRNEGVETEDNRLVFLANVKNDGAAVCSPAIRAVSRKIQTRVFEVFRVSVSVVFGSIGEVRRNISGLYEELLQMAHYKYVLGYGSVIDEETIGAIHLASGPFAYPDEKEKCLVDAIHGADREKITSAYNEIVEYAKPYGYNALITTRNTIAYAVNKVFNKMTGCVTGAAHFDFYTFFSRLEAAETIDESNRLFGELFSNEVAAIEKRSSTAHDFLIAEIVTAIRTDYANVNLGISTFAYAYKVSAAYLGRLFRNKTGKPMFDFINEVRITKVCELLENSSDSMARIMQMTGFTNKTQAYKIFKKYYGVTPRLYRQKRMISKNRI